MFHNHSSKIVQKYVFNINTNEKREKKVYNIPIFCLECEIICIFALVKNTFNNSIYGN
ncbi:hypothetical protein EVA_14255 [gut metagenome]|uniref:Uncharacterized protein n=1 Tax=gut metagenome TaxID=749906 RepID=J9FT20_9ZZZZ